MKKILAIFAAMLVALVANAAVININTGTTDALRHALNSASSGDVIVMAAGTYVESNSDYIAFTGKEVKVMAEEGAEVILVPKVPVRLKSGARAEFVNIKFDCGHLSDLASYSEIIVAADNTEGKKVILDGCEFYGWTQKSNAIVHVRSDRQMDSVVIKNCYFHDNKYTCVYLKYASIQGLEIVNTTFTNVVTDANAPSAAPVHVDATSGNVLIDHCTFYNCEVKNTDYGAIKIPNAVAPVVSNCLFAMPEAYEGGRAVYNADGVVNNCLTYNYSKDDGTGLHSGPTITACIQGDPLFRDAANGDLHLRDNSPAYGAATDGSAVGDPRWVPTMDYYLVGSMNEWTPQEAYKLAVNPDNEAEYKILVTLHMGDEFKIVKSDGAEIATWYPDGMGNNYVVSASGEYTVYFRPAGEETGWYEGYILVQAADLGPWEKQFFLPGGADDYDSYVTYNPNTDKLTVYFYNYKNAQWLAQVKYHGVPAEDGKCYRVALKMKANHDISGVSLKWQDDNDPAVIFEDQTISLEENAVFTYDQVVAGKAGNGILVLDFGFGQFEDVIEIFDVVIEETTCPEPVETKYYLVGTMTEWGAETAYLFEANTAVEGEYILHTYLPEGAGVKVVGVAGEEETWYPDGMGNEYVVDAAHAGWGMVYFRPEGNTAWAAFGGYIYVDAGAGVEQVESVDETVKFFKNGQLFVRKNGVVYTVLGEAVK